jgi:hypothetical protein
MAVVGGEEMTMRWIVSGMKAPKEVMLVLFQESIPKCICPLFSIIFKEKREKLVSFSLFYKFLW